jgi:succinyl-CoA synthetase alpha subunit
MTIMATKALAEDPETNVIVLISKPPAKPPKIRARAQRGR